MLEKIYFASGCFWCTESIFQSLKGIKSVKPGYSGPDNKRPKYEDVASGKTDFVESVEIVYDPKEVSLGDLLTVFFFTHDPTTPNRQGNDIGPQYRSAIFYTNDKQKDVVSKFIDELKNSKAYNAEIITEVSELNFFHEADDYHRNYYQRNKQLPYCQIVIAPKLEKFRKKFNNLIDQQAQD